VKPKQSTLERDDIPRMTLTLTDETIWLTRHDRAGAPAATYPVTAANVANAFNQFGADTGLLAENTLFWQSRGGQLRLGIWIAPGKRTLRLRTGKRLDILTLPLPGLVFVGNGTQYRIFAAKQRPQKATDAIFQCPLPNVYGDGKICAGNVPFPKCDASTIGIALGLFFDSEFNHDLAGEETITLLKSLRNKRAFPLSALKNVSTMGDVLTDGKALARRDVWGETETDAHGIDGIDPYEYAYGETEDDDED
jgi:PRTRC genetic system protein B